MKRGKIWGVLFLLLALLTIWAVISNSEGFSLELLKRTLRDSSAGWMIAAAVSMLGFIVFEGMAILCILRAFGYSRKFGRGFLYSAADIYFSSITPSASGGQPASAYFMMKDGVPGGVVTITLLANLIMYTLALLTVGAVGAVFDMKIFFHFHLLGRFFILLGYGILCVLAAAFYMLVAKPRILERFCLFVLKAAKKIHLIKNIDGKRRKLYRAMKEYRSCADIMSGNKPMFLKAFFYNLLQRISQITVTLFVYLAVGGKMELAADIWFTQSFVAIGTYSVPLPGGMGVADYLLLDGFGAFFDEAEAVNLELISRGLSFYVCMIVSALTVLAGAVQILRRKKAA